MPSYLTEKPSRPIAARLLPGPSSDVHGARSSSNFLISRCQEQSAYIHLMCEETKPHYRLDPSPSHASGMRGRCSRSGPFVYGQVRRLHPMWARYQRMSIANAKWLNTYNEHGDHTSGVRALISCSALEGSQ